MPRETAVGKTVVFDGIAAPVEALCLLIPLVFPLCLPLTFPLVRGLYLSTSRQVVCSKRKISYRGTSLFCTVPETFAVDHSYCCTSCTVPPRYMSSVCTGRISRLVVLILQHRSRDARSRSQILLY